MKFQKVYAWRLKTLKRERSDIFSEQVYGTIMEVLKREELGAERKTISLDEAVPLIEKEEDQ